MPTYTQSLQGRYLALRGFTPAAAGRYRALRDFAQATPGRYKALRGFTQDARGRFRSLRGFTPPLRGRYISFRAFLQALRGRFRSLRAFVAPSRGRYRVADAALALYHLYLAVGADPDPETAVPDASSASLPFVSTAQTDVGPAVLHAIVTRSNEYGLQSFPRAATRIELDADDGALPPRPSAPDSYSASPAAAAELRITASYLYDLDDAAVEADAWRIYLAVGMDPDPAVDTPLDLGADADMVKVDGVAYLDFTTAGGDYSADDDLRVIVRTYRSDDDIESDNSTVVSATAADDGPAVPSLPTALIGAGIAEQQA